MYEIYITKCRLKTEMIDQSIARIEAVLEDVSSILTTRQEVESALLNYEVVQVVLTLSAAFLLGTIN